MYFFGCVRDFHNVIPAVKGNEAELVVSLKFSCLGLVLQLFWKQPQAAAFIYAHLGFPTSKALWKTLFIQVSPAEVSPALEPS